MLVRIQLLAPVAVDLGVSVVRTAGTSVGVQRIRTVIVLSALLRGWLRTGWFLRHGLTPECGEPKLLSLLHGLSTQVT